jgi:hypothetical protein
LGNRAPQSGGEILGSKINGDAAPDMTGGFSPFNGAPLPDPADGPIPF